MLREGDLGHSVPFSEREQRDEPVHVAVQPERLPDVPSHGAHAAPHVVKATGNAANQGVEYVGLEAVEPAVAAWATPGNGHVGAVVDGV